MTHTNESKRMTRRQQLRAEETKRAILDAAQALFAERGFEAVTMREIAKAAGCSHTTIYIYYQDKEALLHQLSLPPLTQLKEDLEATLQNEKVTPEQAVKEMSRQFIRFCLANRTMYTIFFMTNATRVDTINPATEINRLRITLFDLLQKGICRFLKCPEDDARVMMFSRIYFFMLHGIVGTYTGSKEPFDELYERLQPTFNTAIDVMMTGMKQLKQ